MFYRKSYAFVAILIAGIAMDAYAADICKITVVDAESGWPVPLVELRTTHQVRFVSDNAGVIAMDDPALMDRKVWFTVIGHGYDVPADGFGYRGVRLEPRAGAELIVKVQRSGLAKRIGRLTGTGLFSESQKLGLHSNWRDGPVFGCDSVQNAVHNGRLFWAWGDTHLAAYPLGIFHMTSASTAMQPFESLAPPLFPQFDYFAEPSGKPKGVARMPGSGPTWLTGYVSLPDRAGRQHLVALYRKIKPPLSTYEAGLCVWDDSKEEFEHLRTIWRASDNAPEPAALPDGHPAFWSDAQGKEWLLFGNPLPRMRVPATFEAWQDSSQWETLEPQSSLDIAESNAQVIPHSGSIAWNAFRKRWVTVFVQRGGEQSFLGTLWYAEADSPIGPWGPAIEILAHDNYTFYNPRLHPECTDAESPVLLFEGTYTAEFANHPSPTPRYNYNQILYRLDLDDAKLQPAANHE